MNDNQLAEQLLIKNLDSLFIRLVDKKELEGVLWFGIIGTWQITNDEVERDVRAAVQQIMAHGNCIVSGGVVGVDYFATEEALRHDPSAQRIKIFLPIPLAQFAGHFRQQAVEGAMVSEKVEQLIRQLEELQWINPGAIISHDHNKVADLRAYASRNTELVKFADALVAFQVNDSPGTADTVAKALAYNKPVYLKKYVIK
jgi:hypothetical protein